MDKKKQMNFNVNNFLLATTNILDVRDIEMNNVSENHSLRVAYISLKLGEKLAFEPKKMFDLCAYSLFHNYIDESSMRLLKIDDTNNSLSKVVNFVHSIEEKFDFSKKGIKNRIIIKEYISTLKNEKDLKEILLILCDKIDFWLDCQSSQMIQHYIYSALYDFTEVMDFSEVLEITTMFGSLEYEIDNLLKLSKKMADFYSFEEKDKWTFLIATSMANFGKLSVPKEILNKSEKLSEEEYEILKSNLYHNKNALRSIYGFDDIAKWSSRHQEQLDGKGYPFGLYANDLSLKDRLMAVINNYNSMLSSRPYRNKFSHTESIDILNIKEKNYHLDRAIIEDLEKIIE